LNKKNIEIGKTSGEIFFYSTVGSIVGSLLTGFYLIPNFGVREIIAGVGVALVMIGVIGMKGRMIFAVGIFLGFVSLSSKTAESPSVIYSKEGTYERLWVIERKHVDGKDIRMLVSERNASAAAYTDSDELVFDYTKYMHELAKLIDYKPKRALVVGSGAFSLPKALVRDFDEIQVDAVDVEPKLYDISREYFNLSDVSRIKSYVADGRTFLKQNDQKYDIIHLDAFLSWASIPSHLVTKEFFEIVNNNLNDGGIVIGNFPGDLYPSGGNKHYLLSQIKTFREVFGNSYYFAVASKESIKGQNFIFVGIKGDRELDMSKFVYANNLLDLNEIDFNGQIVFTDNYAPAEILLTDMLKRFEFDR
jgi:spermidine synthase